MNHTLPEACLKTLDAIQTDPLNLEPWAEAHLRNCPGCREARVQWLAMEDAESPLVPAGYFDTLPDRVLRKLPGQPVKRLGTRPLLLAAAAALMVAAGIGGYFAGQATAPPPTVTASAPTIDTETLESLPEAPFQDPEDPINQLEGLSPEESRSVLKRMMVPQPPTGSEP